MVRWFFWGFVLLWGVLGAITDSMWVSLLLAVVIFGIIADEESRTALIRWFRWLWIKLDCLAGAGLGLIAIGLMCLGLGLSAPVGVSITLAAFIILNGFAFLGAMAYRRVRNDGISDREIEQYHLTNAFFRDLGAPKVPLRFPLSMPSVFLDACLGHQTDRLALLQACGMAIIAFVLSGLALWLKAPSWYMLPVYFLGGLIAGSAVMAGLAQLLEGGWKILRPSVLPEDEAKAAGAKLAQPDEFKKAGLSHDL